MPNDIENAIADFGNEIAAEFSGEEVASPETEEVEEAEPTEESGETLSFSEDEDAEQSEESEASEEVEESEEEAPPSVITVEADGKKVTIDFNNRDHITRVYQKYVAQARYLKERDEYKSQLEEIRSPESQYSKNQEMIELLNTNIEDPAEMYRLFTGGKDLKELFKTWQQEEDNFALFSESEKKSYLDAKRIEAREKELARKEAAITRKLEESEDKKSKAELAEQQALVTSSFEQYRFNEVSDPDEAHKLDQRLWNDIRARLSAYEDLNKEIVAREIKDASEELRSLLGRRARVEEKKTSTQKKVEAKKSAAKAATQAAAPKPTSFMDGLAAAMKF